MAHMYIYSLMSAKMYYYQTHMQLKTMRLTKGEQNFRIFPYRGILFSCWHISGPQSPRFVDQYHACSSQFCYQIVCRESTKRKCTSYLLTKIYVQLNKDMPYIILVIKLLGMQEHIYGRLSHAEPSTIRLVTII